MTREEAIEKLRVFAPCEYTSGYKEAFDMAVEALQYLQEWGDILQGKPVKHGKWIKHERSDTKEGTLIPNYECTCCHTWEENDSNYCPNCGARMNKEKEE